MTRLLEEINTQIVPPELMADVMQSHAKLHSAARADITEQLLCIIKETRSVETAEDLGRLGISIDFRIRALSKFILDAKNLGLSIDLEDGSSMIKWELVQCAAQEPMLEGNDGYPEFDAQRLLGRYLKLVPVEGRA
ncbi:hypothetical protein SAMN02745824_0249 [Parasphingorhabdus marina DSM 22363]|uniref:Uncharacterized protein n=1 Tax=Parasphingorhabdus marina DSM 22363 TaxID=1123272 RepID=A0A1N6CMK2_9SPHN|nr:hypothetical protein [Parasphingorhabdus marina]SIN59716.1 hypothetical protein SAMN02745824_0249 [Parasphingorhabdus marina DSM 22363]